MDTRLTSTEVKEVAVGPPMSIPKVALRLLMGLGCRNPARQATGPGAQTRDAEIPPMPGIVLREDGEVGDMVEPGTI